MQLHVPQSQQQHQIQLLPSRIRQTAASPACGATAEILDVRNDVRDNNGRMFVQEECVAIQHLTGKQFTYDACCDNSGVNSHCDAYSSPANSFLHSNVSGQQVWLISLAPSPKLGKRRHSSLSSMLCSASRLLLWYALKKLLLCAVSMLLRLLHSTPLKASPAARMR